MSDWTRSWIIEGIAEVKVRVIPVGAPQRLEDLVGYGIGRFTFFPVVVLDASCIDM